MQAPFLRTLGLLVLAALACTDDGSSPSPTPNIAVTVSPAALSVMASGSANAMIRLTRTGYSGPISVSLEGRPAGVTATFSQGTLWGAQTTAMVTVGVARVVPAGTYTLVVRSTASGVEDATAALTLTVTPPPLVSLVITPNPMAIPQGEQLEAAVAITREGGFTGAVALAISGLPNGVTATFGPAIVTGNSAVLTIRVGQLVAPGSYDVTVRGVAQGIPDAAAPLRLVVQPAAGFILTAAPDVLEVRAGGTGTATVTITRIAGFAGVVQLKASGNIPPGVGISIVPSSTAGTSAVLEATAAASAASGVYRITVTGSADGVGARTVETGLAVIGAGGGNVVWAFCEQGGIPTWLAAQDGLTGEWIRIPGEGRRYDISITKGVGAIAWVFGTETSPQGLDVNYLNVMYGSAAELRNAGPVCTGSGALKVLFGTVTNLPADAAMQLSFAGAQKRVLTAGPFTLDQVSDGVADLIATTQEAAGRVTGFIVRRGLNPPNLTSLPDLDWAGVDRIVPAIGAITVTIPPGAATDMKVELAYQTANGVVPTLYATGDPWSFAGLPSSAQAPGDLHLLTQTHRAFGSGSRSVTTFFHAVRDQALTYGPSIPEPGDFLSWNGALPRIRFTRPAEYGELTEVVFDDWTTMARATFWPGYGLPVEVDYTLPDFSMVMGWNPRWGVRGIGPWFTGDATVSGWTPLAEPGKRPAVEGAVIRTASRTGTYPP
jgi:hypothetical protein